MKFLLLLSLFPLIFLLSGCCDTYNGYGRHVLRVDCDKVIIDGVSYKITRAGTDYMVAGHSFSRGIYRKTRPWLYVHRIDGDNVDITFDSGAKDIYPLYTGSSGSIFDVYRSNGWDISQSTCIAFVDKTWLVAHRWTNDGIYFDLQKNGDDVADWQLIKEDLLLSQPNGQLDIPEITAKVILTSFNLNQKSGHIIISSMP
jgi:hypothetical protein